MGPKDLRNTGDNVADVRANFGDPAAHVHGFMAAAATMAERMAKNKGAVDTEIYAALTLYRHAVEIGFKEILRTIDYKESGQAKKRHRHDLSELWQELRPQLDEPAIAGRDAKHFRPEAVAWIEAAVTAIHRVDPDGFETRYSTNKRAQPTMKDVQYVNLDVFRDMCQKTERWLLEVLEYRLTIDNHLRHQRGYFKTE